MVALAHRYTPRGGAKALFTCKDSEVLLSGPAGTGKSRACLEKLNLVALKYAGMRGLILRKTLVSLTTSGLVTWQRYIIPEAEYAGIIRWFGGSRREPAEYRYENGSTIAVGGLDNAGKIMSTEYDVIYVQEAIDLTVDDWEALTTRLRNGVMPYQQLIADTNPSTPTHWLKRRVDDGITTMLDTVHEDNPVYFNDKGEITKAGKAYLKKLDALTGVRFQRLRRGLWTSAEGIIYEQFDPTVHVVDRFKIPDSWERYWAIDFGYRNPFVWQDWAVDPDGRVYLDKEIYFTGRLVADHARQILAAVAPNGIWTEPRPTKIICDHDAEDRATLERELELPTIAATKTVSDGIQAVQTRLQPYGDGKARLYFLRNALIERDLGLLDSHKPISTVDEITGYTWDPAGKTPKEAPLKDGDHGMDAMRYLIAYLDLKGAPRARWFSSVSGHRF